MSKCIRLCFRCFSALKPKRNSQIRIEATQLNNSFNFKSSTSIANDEECKLPIETKLKRFPSPFKTSIITGRSIKSVKSTKSARPVHYFYPNENLENLSAISKKSYNEDLTPVRIPTPIENLASEKVAPVIFSPMQEGKLPKLFLAVPRVKYPRSKSIQVYKNNEEFVFEEPKESN